MNALQKLTRYKAWANELIFDAVAKLPEAALVAPQQIVFGNLLRTLNHVLAMDFVWQSHLRGEAHGLATRNPEFCPTLAEVAQAQVVMDRCTSTTPTLCQTPSATKSSTSPSSAAVPAR